MIKESILITTSKKGVPHIAPMGIKYLGKKVIISPYIPSQTYNNLLENSYAVINYTDDVSIFANCITGKKVRYKLKKIKSKKSFFLQNACTYYQIKVVKLNDSKVRPSFTCKIISKKILKPFEGFNRAQFSVIEAAILVSRLGLLSIKKIKKEINYLKIAIDKTAGIKEKLAWNLLIRRIKNYKKK